MQITFEFQECLARRGISHEARKSLSRLPLANEAIRIRKVSSLMPEIRQLYFGRRKIDQSILLLLDPSLDIAVFASNYRLYIRESISSLIQSTNSKLIKLKGSELSSSILEYFHLHLLNISSSFNAMIDEYETTFFSSNESTIQEKKELSIFQESVTLAKEIASSSIQDTVSHAKELASRFTSPSMFASKELGTIRNRKKPEPKVLNTAAIEEIHISDDEELPPDVLEMLQVEHTNLLLEQENRIGQMKNVTDSIQRISELQTQIALQVHVQKETIGQIYNDSITANNFVERGNKNLDKANNLFSSYRVFLIMFFVIISFLLLIVDWWYS